MDNFFPKENPQFLNPLFTGHEKCKSGHSYTYYDCEYHIVHYCISGRGRVVKDGVHHDVTPGSLFLIRPGETVGYTADLQDPWEYVWIAFDFDGSDIFSGLPIVSEVSTDNFISVAERTDDGDCDRFFAAGTIYMLLSELLKNKTTEKIDYPKNVKRFIQLRYREDISVEQIARSLNINRRYMSRIFKERYGKTVMDYLVEYRLKKASEQLLSGLGVAEAAARAGYHDVFNFSKMFKKKYSVSPAEYKKQGHRN